MASVSYLSDIDTRPFEIKPTTLPWESFFKEFATKQQYFTEGALQIQNAYKNVLDLNPAFKENQEYLKSFLSSAQSELDKVVKSDMTIGDNISRARGVFTPIFDQSNPRNKLVLQDSEIMKFYQGELLKAEQARKTGKWHQDNEFYMKSQYQSYLNDAQSGDVSKVEDQFNKRRPFVPYYDPLPDIEKVMKLCKEDQLNQTGVSALNPMYFETSNEASISVHKAAACLGMLPPQARQQIGISSYAQYHDKPSELLKDYKYLVIGNIENQIKGITQVLAFLPETGLNQEQQAHKTRLTAELSALKENLSEAELSWKNMTEKTGELGFIIQNLPAIAEQVGFNQFVNRAATTLSYSKIDKELSANAVSLANFKAQNDWNRDILNFKQAQVLQNNLFDQQRTLAILRASLEGGGTTSPDPFATGGVGVPSPVIGITLPGSGEALPATYKEFQTEHTGAKTELISSISTLRAAFKNYINNNSELDEEEKKILLSSGRHYSINSVAPQSIDDISDDVLMNLVNSYDKNSAVFGAKDDMLEAQIARFRKAHETKKKYDLENNYLLSKLKIDDLKTPAYKFPYNNSEINLSRLDILSLSEGSSVKGFTYHKTGWMSNDYLLTPNGTKVEITKNHPLYSAFKLGLPAIKVELNEQAHEVYKTRNRQINEHYLLNLPTEKAEDNYNRQIRQETGVPEIDEQGNFIHLGTKSRSASGDLWVQLSVLGKDAEAKIKVNKTLSTDEMKKLIPSNPKTEIKTLGGVHYLVIKNKFPQQNLLSINRFNMMVTYTAATLPYLNETEFDKQGLELTNDQGVRFRVKAGNVNASTGQVLYKVSRENSTTKEWQTFEDSYPTIEKVLALIDTDTK